MTFAPTPTDDPIPTTLLSRYFTSRELGFTTHPGGYRVVHPDPADFTPPKGVFLVMLDDDGAPIGCGGIRQVADLGAVATFEVKHLWLEEPVRGQGLSHVFMAELEYRARDLGAQQVVLDTNKSLTAAQALYRSRGYTEIPAYNDNRNATHWFAKRLGARSTHG